MNLRFGIAQMVVATGLVASLGAPAFARDDDPRDFRRNDSRDNDTRYESRNTSRNDSSNFRRDNDDDERNRNQNGRNNNHQNNHNNSNGGRDDRDRDDRDDRDEDRPDRPKVTVCHKSEIDGDDDDDDRRSGVRAKTIQVSQNAVAAHLQHGDTLGPCVVSPFRPHKYHKDRD